MLTHLIPPIGAKRQGHYPIPGGGLSEADYENAARAGGYKGDVVVGRDLSSLRMTE